ncbi:9642_t:CDS:2, partial [Acaulospora morrowiae]
MQLNPEQNNLQKVVIPSEPDPATNLIDSTDKTRDFLDIDKNRDKEEIPTSFSWEGQCQTLVSEDSLVKEQNFYDIGFGTVGKSDFSGFSTANGRHLNQISEDSFRKTLDSFGICIIPENALELGFSSASDHNLGINSEYSFDKAHKSCNVDSLDEDSFNALEKPTGFATASGKCLNAVSEGLLVEARNSLKVDSEMDLSNGNSDYLLEEDSFNALEKPTGFTTASGKCLNAVSEDLLIEARNSLKIDSGMDLSNGNSDYLPDEDSFNALEKPTGFATASGKCLNVVSEGLLVEARNSLKIDSEMDLSNGNSDYLLEEDSFNALEKPTGFATASGKCLNAVSEDLLIEARNSLRIDTAMDLTKGNADDLLSKTLIDNGNADTVNFLTFNIPREKESMSLLNDSLEGTCSDQNSNGKRLLEINESQTFNAHNNASIRINESLSSQSNIETDVGRRGNEDLINNNNQKMVLTSFSTHDSKEIKSNLRIPSNILHKPRLKDTNKYKFTRKKRHPSSPSRVRKLRKTLHPNIAVSNNPNPNNKIDQNFINSKRSVLDNTKKIFDLTAPSKRYRLRDIVPDLSL